MKEFNYEQAKAGTPVCTRDGRSARIICWDSKGGSMHIIALITDGDVELLSYYYDNGKSTDGSDSDLMMAPVKHEGWVHVNNEFGVPFIVHGKIYKTKEHANAAPKAERFITVAKIEWEE